MSQFLVAAIGSGSILAIVPATDPGRRRATTWRLVRSLLAVVIVCGVFVHSLPLHGNDRPARLAGVGLGVLCGLVAGQFLPVSRDGGEIVIRAGRSQVVTVTPVSGPCTFHCPDMGMSRQDGDAMRRTGSAVPVVCSRRARVFVSLVPFADARAAGTGGRRRVCGSGGEYVARKTTRRG